MDLDKIPAWILDLEPEDAGFLKNPHGAQQQYP